MDIPLRGNGALASYNVNALLINDTVTLYGDKVINVKMSMSSCCQTTLACCLLNDALTSYDASAPFPLAGKSSDCNIDNKVRIPGKILIQIQMTADEKQNAIL